MTREHVSQIRFAVDDQSMPIGLGFTIAALVFLPLLGNGVGTVGRALDLGAWTLSVVGLAHVPVVVALIGVWSVGCDVCR